MKATVFIILVNTLLAKKMVKIKAKEEKDLLQE